MAECLLFTALPKPFRPAGLPIVVLAMFFKVVGKMNDTGGMGCLLSRVGWLVGSLYSHGLLSSG